MAGGGAAEWLAPDWQGTIGDAVRDPWGAVTAPGSGVGSGLELGYRGELEFDGETWLRNRAYEPVSRFFLQPDPLPAVPGTAWAANPYHYAGHNPIGLSDPLGLRPISDSELQEHRDRMNRDFFEKAGDFVEENIDYIAAGAMIVGGGLLMATGVGGPIGLGLISTGVSAGMQKFTTGEVNWKQAAVDGVIGAVTGGVGGSLVRQAVVQTGGSVVSGMADRGLNGGNAFDPGGLGMDVLMGGVAPVPGGRLGVAKAVPDGPTSQILLRTPEQLQSKFKHAGDFGVTGNYSKANAAEFSSAIHQHINSPSVQAIQGTYHKQPVTQHLDASSGLNVMADPSGNFISGWKLNPAQLQNVLSHGGL